MAKTQKPADIDGYISQFPAEVQASLERIRETIRQAAPDAKEVISYQMPAFRQYGILVYFAAWKNHIGRYPPIPGDKSLEKSVARYAGPKGNLQFPLDEPMPLDLIERIVKLRVKQDAEKVAAKRKKKWPFTKSQKGADTRHDQQRLAAILPRVPTPSTARPKMARRVVGPIPLKTRIVDRTLDDRGRSRSYGPADGIDRGSGQSVRNRCLAAGTPAGPPLAQEPMRKSLHHP